MRNHWSTLTDMLIQTASQQPNRYVLECGFGVAGHLGRVVPQTLFLAQRRESPFLAWDELSWCDPGVLAPAGAPGSWPRAGVARWRVSLLLVYYSRFGVGAQVVLLLSEEGRPYGGGGREARVSARGWSPARFDQCGVRVCQRPGASQREAKSWTKLAPLPMIGLVMMLPAQGHGLTRSTMASRSALFRTHRAIPTRAAT